MIPNIELARGFLKLLDEEMEFCTVQTFLDDKSGTERKRREKELSHVFAKVCIHDDGAWDPIIALNLKGAGIAVAVNETDLKGRQKSNMRRIRTVFMEDDGEGVEPPIPPHIVVVTSVGRCHRYWLVEGMSRDDAELVQQTMVDVYHSDPRSKDISRALRLPGFLHCKDPGNIHIPYVEHTSGMPPYRADYVMQKIPPAKPRVHRAVQSLEGKPMPEDEYRRIQGALKHIPSDERDIWLDVGMALHSTGARQAFALWDSWAQQSDKYNADDQIDKWNSFGRRSGVTVGTIYWRAKQNGWRDTQVLAQGKDAVRQQITEEAGEPFFTMDELRISAWLTTEPKAPEWILTGIMPRGKTGMVTAPGGTGKSFALMQLGISVASGLPLFGKYPVERPGGVMALFSEDDADELHRRFATCVRTICDTPGIDTERFKMDLEKNLFVRSMVGMDLTITRPSPEGPMLTANFDKFLATAKQVPDLLLLILDPLIRFRGGSENDASENTLLVEAGERIAQETGAFVLWCNHSNKYSMRQGNAMEQDAARGSSALTDGMRWQMNLATMSDHIAKKCGISKKERRFYVQMAIPKNNYAPPFGETWLKRGEGGYLSYTELEDVDALENERILTQAIKIIKERAEAGDEYSKRRFCERFGGKAGELKCGENRLRVIIELGIEQGRIEERKPQKEMRNVTAVLGVAKW